MVEEKFLSAYERYSAKAEPASFLSGDLDKREVTITLTGERKDDLGGAVKRRLLADINRYFWEHPRDADDTRLVYEAEEKSAKYEEKGGKAKLVLKLRVELATNRPEEFCC